MPQQIEPMIIRERCLKEWRIAVAVTESLMDGLSSRDWRDVNVPAFR